MLRFLTNLMQPVNASLIRYKRIFLSLLWVLLYFQCQVLYSAQNTCIDTLLYKLESINTDNERADQMLIVAKEYYYSDIQEAIRYAKMANELFNKIDNKQGIGQSLNLIGAANFALGNYNIAESNFNDAMAISKQINDTEQTAKVLNNLGGIKLKTGELSSAINYYTEAGKLFVLQNNLDGAFSIENSLSSIYRSNGSYNEARKHLNKAISVAERSNNKHLLGTAYHNLGALLIEIEEYDEALEASQKSYSYRLESGHLAGQIKNLINLGSIFHETGKTSASDTCYKRALYLSEENGYTEDKAYILMHLGYLQICNKEYKNAEGYLIKSLDLAKKLEDIELQMQLHNYLYLTDSVTGNFKSALAHFQSYINIKSEFGISQSDKKLEELENLYKLAKEENTLKGTIIQKSRSVIISLILGIILLTMLAILIVQQIIMRSQRKTSELAQENLRSQMNPHFIFNILNSIHSFILNNDSKSSSNYLMKFSHLLRITLDNSINKLATINDELNALKLYLELESMRFNNQLEYNIIVDEEIDPLMFKIPTLLLQPYVENAIIHGLQNKNGKGKIEIRLDYQNNNIHCSITDNGIGRKKAESLKQINGSKHKSHGTQITETRLKLLNTIYRKKFGVVYTDILDEDKNCKGTKVEFNLPVLN